VRRRDGPSASSQSRRAPPRRPSCASANGSACPVIRSCDWLSRRSQPSRGRGWSRTRTSTRTTRSASAVEETAQQLDRASLAKAADAIAGASRVDIYGIGASAIVGTDAQQKLHRIGVIAFSWNDPHIALTSAALLGKGDVAIGISHSGTTRETIESLTTARARGATTIAITNFPLSQLVDTADIVLTTAARETSLRSGATASRIAALTVIDCLYIAVAQRDLPRARKAVADTRAAVSGHHLGG